MFDKEVDVDWVNRNALHRNSSRIGIIVFLDYNISLQPSTRDRHLHVPPVKRLRH